MPTIRSSFYLSSALILAFTTASLAVEIVPADLAAKRAGKASLLADSELGLIYTPIAPCRAFAPTAPQASGKTANFKVTGSDSLVAQGGPSIGCGIPASAKAISVNFSAVTPTSNGYLRAFAAGTPRPIATALNYRSGVTITSASTVALGEGGELSVYVSGGTRVIGDVTGYFEPQLWAYVGPNGALIDSSGRVQSVTRNGIGNYTVTFDRSVDSCAAVTSSDISPKLTAAYTSGNSANVRVTAILGLLPDDGYFNLFVKC
ncbi:hypothetical protein [Methylopila sp. M107]|uniref:hypothetical protein n=1 Tax=Methylopila sp. M107 TaxID=1101190 RepID=UPI00036D8CC9|nr:hypothetical protein [Methylopila sp. M107]